MGPIGDLPKSGRGTIEPKPGFFVTGDRVKVPGEPTDLTGPVKRPRFELLPGPWPKLRVPPEREFETPWLEELLPEKFDEPWKLRPEKDFDENDDPRLKPPPPLEPAKAAPDESATASETSAAVHLSEADMIFLLLAFEVGHRSPYSAKRESCRNVTQHFFLRGMVCHGAGPEAPGEGRAYRGVVAYCLTPRSRRRRFW